MAKLKNPEINSILYDKEEQERLDEEQAQKEYFESQIEYKEEQERREKEEYEQKTKEIKEKNKKILSIDPNYEEELKGDRRGVFYDEHYDFNNDSFYVDVYEERPEGAYTGRLTDTVYQGGSSYTNWGCGASIPAHWSNKNAEDYLEMRSNGYKISEKLFDKYLKSEAKNIDAFLNVEKFRSKISKGVEKAEKSPKSAQTIASIATIRYSKENTK